MDLQEKLLAERISSSQLRVSSKESELFKNISPKSSEGFALFNEKDLSQSNHITRRFVRKPRGCTEISKPVIVVVLLLYSAITFYVLILQDNLT